MLPEKNKNQQYFTVQGCVPTCDGVTMENPSFLEEKVYLTEEWALCGM